MTIVYQQSGSCVGVHSALDPANYPLSSANGAATYYTPGGQQNTCVLDPGEGLVADVGASDVFYSTCYLGQATHAAPARVRRRELRAGAGHELRRPAIVDAAEHQPHGGLLRLRLRRQQYPVPPWTDPTQLQIRNANSGTQALIAAAISVPPAQWSGVNHSTSAQVGAALVAAGQSGTQKVIDSALGILASDYLLQNTQSLRGLAVQDTTPGCGYYPNSTAFARDNANARDGHYPLWGPVALLRARRSVDQPAPQARSLPVHRWPQRPDRPPRPRSRRRVRLEGSRPECAMHVTRASDGGDYTPFKAPVTCNCYFELHATGATTCQPCGANGECPPARPTATSSARSRSRDTATSEPCSLDVRRVRARCRRRVLGRAGRASRASHPDGMRQQVPLSRRARFTRDARRAERDPSRPSWPRPGSGPAHRGRAARR